MHKSFLLIASLLAAISVVLGAFGAHALRKLVPADAISTFETGVRYQFYHVFGLFITAILFQQFPNKWLIWSGDCFIIGIILFSGSLYLLTALHATENAGLKKVGIITPVGGLFLIAAWLLLAVGIYKKI